MAKLLTYVHVHDDVGQRHVFGPGDDVPKWAAEKITNPDAWDGDVEPAETGSSETGVPPASGKGSSRDAWAAYAERHNLEVPAGFKREEIVELLETHGIPTVQQEG